LAEPLTSSDSATDETIADHVRWALEKTSS
jgi:hypothetical protein